MVGGWSSHALATSPLVRNPITHCKGGRVGVGSGLNGYGEKNTFAPTGVWTAVQSSTTNYSFHTWKWEIPGVCYKYNKNEVELQSEHS